MMTLQIWFYLVRKMLLIRGPAQSELIRQSVKNWRALQSVIIQGLNRRTLILHFPVFCGSLSIFHFLIITLLCGFFPFLFPFDQFLVVSQRVIVNCTASFDSSQRLYRLCRQIKVLPGRQQALNSSQLLLDRTPELVLQCQQNRTINLKSIQNSR